MLLILHPFRRLSFLISSSSTIRRMGSKHLLKPTHLPVSLSPPLRLLRPSRRLCPSFSSKPISRTRPVFCLQTNGLSCTSVRYEDSEQEEDGQVKITGLPKSAKLSRRMEELGIHIDSCVSGQYSNLLCPMCNGGDSMEKSLSVFIERDWDSARWVCFRAKCGWKGRTKSSADRKPSNGSLKPVSQQKKIIRKISEEGLGLEPLSDELIAYFALRSISKGTLKRHLVMQQINYEGQADIAFTYRRKGELISVKYRGTTKSFRGEKDTEKIFYGLDDIEGETDIIIVEGEMDKLAMAEAGFHNCVSVPDGAPPSVSQKEVPPEDQDTKYQYLWNCKEYLKKASRIIIATDGDSPGKALAEELARRIGRERCWRVEWPMRDEVKRFKDANEVLMILGADALKEVIDNAELYPIRGLFNFRDYFNEIDAYYHRTHDSDFGISTGWKSLNSLYNVVPGELTIVTGVPNSGKSEWIDALLCNLNEIADWKFALCSMENKVRDHARKLLEKRVKKPFFDERYGESIERMSVEELEEGKQWLSDTFSLIRCEDDSLPSIKWVLDLAKAAVLRHGVRGLVIDPYNELDHQRPTSQTETEYVSQMLTKVKRFAQHHSCHVWFVAHPRQLHQWNGGPPNLYDISGSAHFINKCDNGLVIHRNRDPSVGPIDQVQVCVRKVRNKVIGTIGEAFLSYDRTTGLYSDIDDLTCT